MTSRLDLAAVEEYHHACLDDALGPLFEQGMAAGVADLHGWNAHGVEVRADRPALDVVAEWRVADAETRRRLRERDGGEMATSVGPYSVRWQAFHIASELATHGDDLWVPVDPTEQHARLAWRVPFSRFSLSESKPDVETEAVDGGTRVRADEHEAVLDDLTFVEAVAGRLPDDTEVDPEIVEALSTAP